MTRDQERSGRTGAERLTEFLDRTLGAFVDGVSECGGDVVAFAGDSALAVWEDASAVPRATACALDLLERHRAGRADGGLYLPLRVSVGAGQLRRMELGGERDQWVHLLAGKAVEEALRADGLRLENRVILSPEVAKRLGTGMRGEWLHGHFALSSWLSAPRLDPVQRSEASVSRSLLEAFVPKAVAQRLEAGPEQFVAEFRNVTSVFCALEPILVDGLSEIQEIVVTAQRSLERYEGVFHQLVQDEKGLTLVATFGVPPRSHDDDPERAVEFASELLDLLGRSGIRSRVAISTGSVYCGGYGGKTRRQYGAVGESMNRTAHLVAVAPLGAVVCDETTRLRASRRRQFVLLPLQQIKGEHEPISVYLVGASWNEPPRPLASRGLVGRAPLREALSVYLDRLRDDGDRPPLLVLEGEAGLGKTSVLLHLYRLAQHSGMRVVWSQGEAFRAAGTHSAIRSLLLELMLAAPEFARSQDDVWQPGLLHALLPEHFAAETAVADLTPQRRLESLIELVRAWCAAATRSRPLLWIVEDGHWVDTASQSVIRGLAASIPHFGIVFAQRPFPPSAVALRAGARELLTLQPLTDDEIAQVLAVSLGVSSVPAPLVQLIQKRAAGNPLFAEELAHVLAERGDIEVVAGECHVRASPRELANVSAPPSLERIITTRVDRLEPRDQLTLKAASVLGRTFDVGLLRRVALDADDPSVDAQLERLAAAGFLESAPQDGRMAFRHPLFQEITYASLVRGQRELLHRRAAEALEGNFDPRRAGELASLAFHWEQSGDLKRALPLLRAAAEAAQHSYANEESIDLHARALRTHHSLRGDERIDLDVARIERNMGNALTGLAEHARAREHYFRALRACGVPVPAGGASLAREAVRHLLHRARRALTGRGAPELRGFQRECALEAAHVIGDLVAAVLWLGDQQAYAHSVLLLANLGDGLEPSAESAGATSGLGYLLGLTYFRGAGERDMRRGLAGASAESDPEIRVICSLSYGLFLTGNGRPAESVQVLAPASELAAGLASGLWRHRSRFQLAEALLMSGELAAARDRFDEAVALSRLAEPHVVGLANALGALARAGLGDDRVAMDLLLGEDGIDTTRRNQAKLPLFASLGALAEVSCLTGLEPERGAAAAREAESLAGDWSDTAAYFAGYFGHAGLMEWWLDALERGDGAAEAHVRLGLARMRAFARRYPAAWPRVWLCDARLARVRGKRSHAAHSLSRAVKSARLFGQGRDLREAEARQAVAPGVNVSARELRGDPRAGDRNGG